MFLQNRIIRQTERKLTNNKNSPIAILKHLAMKKIFIMHSSISSPEFILNPKIVILFLEFCGVQHKIAITKYYFVILFVVLDEFLCIHKMVYSPYSFENYMCSDSSRRCTKQTFLFYYVRIYLSMSNTWFDTDLWWYSKKGHISIMQMRRRWITLFCFATFLIKAHIWIPCIFLFTSFTA